MKIRQMESMKTIILFMVMFYVNSLNMVQTRGLTRYKNSFILNVARNMNSKPCPLLEHFDNRQKRADDMDFETNKKIVWSSISGPWEIKHYDDLEDILTQQGEVSMLD